MRAPTSDYNIISTHYITAAELVERFAALCSRVAIQIIDSKVQTAFLEVLTRLVRSAKTANGSQSK